MSIYTELEAAVLPGMTHYQTDVTTHDRAAIERNPHIPFIHWACPMHTHILFLYPSDHANWPAEGEYTPYLFWGADRWHILRENTGMAAYFNRADVTTPFAVHYFDGWHLRKITLTRAIELAATYKARVTREWTRKHASAV